VLTPRPVVLYNFARAPPAQYGLEAKLKQPTVASHIFPQAAGESHFTCASCADSGPISSASAVYAPGMSGAVGGGVGVGGSGGGVGLFGPGKYERSHSFRGSGEVRRREKLYVFPWNEDGAPCRLRQLTRKDGALPSSQHRSGSVAPQFQLERLLPHSSTPSGTPFAQIAVYIFVFNPAAVSVTLSGRFASAARVSGTAIGASGETVQFLRLRLLAGPFVIHPPPIE
jgi:hypothetical protein